MFAHIYIWCIPHVLGKKPNEIFRNVNSANHGNTLNYWFSGFYLNDFIDRFKCERDIDQICRTFGNFITDTR